MVNPGTLQGRHLPVLLSFVMLAALLLPRPAFAGQEGVWYPFDCPLQVESRRPLECGVLEVPENRDKPDSARILLHVRIFRAVEPTGLAPVVYLSGGPGQGMDFMSQDGMEAWAWYLRDGMAWADGRDVVLFTQRGITVQGVGLECPELGDPKVYLGAGETPEQMTDWMANAVRANRSCLDGLRKQGRDLSGYSTRQSAADVEALRQALGLQPWVLFGTSYGTRLGLAVMRDHPAGVEAAILDSVFPPEVTDHWTDISPFVAALGRLYAQCAADRRCAKTYPGLEQRVDALLDRLSREPVTLHVRDPEGKSPDLWFRLDDTALLDMIFFNLYWINGMEALPLALDALDRGDLAVFEDVLAGPYVYDSLFQGWSYGMQMAISCNDDGADFDPSAVETEVAEHAAHPRIAAYARSVLRLPVCDGWPTAPEGDRFSDPVQSPIPTLLLSGELDPVTPTSFARRALAGLSAGQLVVVPRVGHAVLDAAECARDIVAAFLDDPLAPVEDGCASVMPKLRFEEP